VKSAAERAVAQGFKLRADFKMRSRNYTDREVLRNSQSNIFASLCDFASLREMFLPSAIGSRQDAKAQSNAKTTEVLVCFDCEQMRQ